MNDRTELAGSFIDVLTQRAQHTPESVALRFVEGDAGASAVLTYAQLDGRARSLAARLQRDAQAGERALIVLPSGLDYVTGFFACLYSGVIAVPAYPPESLRPQHLARLQGMLADAAPRFVLTSAEIAAALRQALGAALPPGCEVIEVDGQAWDDADGWRHPMPARDTTAFLQYTSGSTSQPKGVEVTHGNLVANETAIEAGFGMTEGDVVVSWLPLYHDMGLIGGLLQPVHSGVPLVLMSPRNFLERPARWLAALSTYGGSVSGGPDFAFRLCTERVPDAALAGLDLSAWRVAFCGSEPIRPETLRDFAARFARCGLDASALYPCYGLAEGTLFVTGGRRGAGVDYARFDAAALARDAVRGAGGDGEARGGGAALGDAASVELVACGATQAGHEVRIMTAAGVPTANGVGEIWASGPSIAKGYWNNPQASADTFVKHDSRIWLRTGDLGFVDQGRLFVTGRAKDMIILRGQNLYPQDVEAAVADEVELVRKGRVAAFPVRTPQGEGLGVAAEIGRSVQKMVAPQQLADAIADAAARVSQEAPVLVLLLQPGALPKTSSGKLQRSSCLPGWRAGAVQAYAAFERGQRIDEAAAAAAVPPPGDGAVGALLASDDDVAAILAALWRKTLGVEHVGPDSGFLRLGGNSIGAVQIVAAAREQYRLPLEISDLLDGTLADAAAAVAQRPRLPDGGQDASRVDIAAQSAAGSAQAETAGPSSAADSASVPLTRAADMPRPLEPAQARMWFLWQMDPSSAAYNLAGRLRLQGALDLPALRLALQDVAQRHASLRTRFELDGDIPVQRVTDDADWSIEIDAAITTDASIDSHIDAATGSAIDTATPIPTTSIDPQSWALSIAQRPFDLLASTPRRAVLLRQSDTEHLLVLSLHHILADGASMAVLLRDFMAAYQARCSARAPAWQAPMSYLEGAARQRARHTDAERDRLLNYWRAHLGDNSDALPLPARRSRPARRSAEGGSLAFTFDPADVQAIRAFGRAQGYTVFELIATAFATLLARCSGSALVQLGLIHANRDERALSDVVGLFVNTLALRLDLPAHARVQDVLHSTAQRLRAAQQHGGLPFDALVEALRPERVPGCHPLFQVLLNHQHVADAGVADNGLRWEAQAVDPAPARFDLGLATVETPDGALRGTLNYAQDMFDAADVADLRDGFLQLLRECVGRPAARLSELQLLAPDAQTRVRGWSQGPRLPVHEGAEVLDLIAQQLAAEPDAEALVCQAATLSRGELDRRAHHVAAALRAQGVGPEDRVALLFERGIDLVVAVLAVLRAGAAYVPVDVDYPADRQRYLIQDSGARLVLTHAEAAPRLAAQTGVPVLRLEDAQSVTGAAAGLVHTPIHPENLAYVIYTSGSTGLPKAAANTHRALSARLRWMREAYGFGPQDTLLHKTPLNFDVAVWELLLPLTVGARLVIAAPGDHRDPQQLARLIQQHDVAAVHFVPSMLAQFIEQDEVRACRRLRYLYSGGEALTPALRDRVMAILPQTRLDNRYGPSEAAINATWWRCQAGDGASAPIGTPVPDGSAYVLDEALNLLPLAVQGPLFLGGTGLARGYLGRPALTAERFLPDPHARTPGSRLYDTGDLARWRADGAIEYLGRADAQLKLRGFRVEPGEIEAQLQTHPDVAAVAVVPRSGPDGGVQLAAYVVGPADDSLAGLVSWLGERVPAHMVPSAWCALAALPLLPSGKLDRRALPDAAPANKSNAGSERGSKDASPLNADALPAHWHATERQVAAIWAAVLGRAPSSLDDNFFDLGGHSLLATQAVTRIRRDVNIELPLRTLFEAKDLRAFAAEVERARAAGHRPSQPALVPVPRGQALPLSYSQERMWFLWDTDRQGAAYNVGGMVMLEGPLHADALQQALDALVQRHEALRTRFPADGGRPVQWIDPQGSIRIAHEDLAHLDANQRRDAVAQRAHAEAHAPFDLEHGPLLRVTLLRESGDRHALLVTIHHIISEGWAMDVFADEYVALYDAVVTGRPANLAPLAVQYGDYAAWQRRWLEGGEGARQLDFWKQTLGSEHPVLNLPSDRPRPAVQSYRGDYLRFELAPALTTQLHQLAQTHRATLFMVVSAGLMALLYRYTGQSDVRLGYPVANRVRPELEGLIGAFLNTQALRCELSGEQSVADLLAQLRDAALAAQAHQDVPFHQVVDAVKPVRSAAHTPLFQVLCNVQRWRFQQTRSAAGLTLRFLPNDPKSTKFDLMLDVSDIDDVLGCMLTYSTDLFDRATMERFARHWVRVLEAMVARPDQRLDSLHFQDEDELRRAHAHAWGPRQPVTLPPVHQAFEAQAARTPQAEALVSDEGRWSYDALNRRANRLAHHLCALGVADGDRVGVCLYRGADMVTALLAVLKAGAAYVPLDPDYPDDRLAYMVDNARPARVLVSHDTLGRLPAQTPTLDLDAAWSQCAAQSDANLNRPCHGESLAYVIYTSGSTGMPKGAGNRHAALSNRIQWMQREYQLDAQDTVLQKTPFGFDVSVWEFFWPLVTGARLAMAAPGDHRDPVALARAMQRWQVTTVHFVPAMLQAFTAEPEAAACTPLTRIIASGEALPADLRDRALANWPAASLHNLYGPTEAAIDVTHWRCAAQDGPLVPIGKPIDNVSVYVLDSALNVCPEGIAGELYLGGVALAQGYWDRPGLSAERFVPDPHGAPGARLYRTGDLARWRADGAIDYLGRLDHQVKIRGLRVELGEIETRIAAQPRVREAVVMARRTGASVFLAAYVTPVDGAELDTTALRDELARGVPDYMVPSVWTVMPALPLSANGKIDRKALPAVDLSSVQGAYEAPRGEAESALAAIMAQVLGVDRVGRQDNFFALGGDSIVSLQVVGKARLAGWQLSARDVFQYQTVAELAGVARPVADPATSDGAAGLGHGPARVAGEGELELLPIQRSFFEQGMARPSHWNQSVLLRVHAPLNGAALRAALTAVLAQHDALRLRFAADGRAWHGTADTADAVLWERDVQDAEALLPLYESAQRSLSLEQGPLLRAVWARLSDGEARLLLVAHHLVIDGVSWRVLLGDLQQGYRQALAGQAVQLDAPSQSYKGWSQALWSRADAMQAEGGGENARQEADYWRAQQGAPDDVPCDNPLGRATVADEAQITLRLDAAHTQQLLRDTSKAYCTQINDLLLTALLRAMDTWRGASSPVTVGLEGHGRDALADQDVSRSVGWFTTLYPVRLNAAGSLDAAIKQVKEQLRAVPSGGAGYGLLCARDPRLAQAMREPGVIFNYLGQFDASFGPDALWSPAVDEPAGATRDADAPLGAKLVFNGRVYDGELTLTISYSAQQYQTASVQALAAAYERALREVIAHCADAAQGGITPSDVPWAGLTQAQLDALSVPALQIEDVYGLSPMQQGLFFHAQSEPDTPLYVNQLTVPVTGLDADRLVQAWKTVTARHAVLRSSFEWPAGARAPVQIVQRAVHVPVRVEDWREGSAAPGAAIATPQTSALDALALEERARGFDLAVAPLQRLALVRTSDTQHHLIWTHHHILLDGWSAAALLAEVLRVYRGDTLAAPAGQFRDYIGWLAERDAHADEAFWQHQLQALEEPCLLTGAGPQPGEGGQDGLHTLVLDPAVSDALANFAQQQRITLNTLAQGAWLLLLQRLTGRLQVCAGVTVSGRPEQLDHASALGLYINTLPLASDVPPSLTVGAWLRELQSRNADLREHGHVPLAHIQRWSGHAGQPLFDTMIAFENYPVDAVLAGGTGEADLHFERPQAHERGHYAVALSVTAGDTLRVDFRHDLARVGEARMQEWAAAYARVLSQLARSGDGKLAGISLLDDAQRAASVQRAAGVRRQPRAGLVPEWIADQARATPLAPALVHGDQVLNYAELLHRADAVAARLAAAGVGAENRVAVHAERGVGMAIALLGIMRAGAAYVPVTPDLPPARLRHLLRDSGAVMVLSDRSDALPDDMDLPCGPLEAAGEALDAKPGRAAALNGAATAAPRLSPANLAYCIYTSGSTGMPKGTGNTHEGLANRLDWMQHAYPIGPGDRVLQKTPFGFDVSVWEFFWPWSTGATLVMADPGAHRDPVLLREVIVQQQITTLHFVPSMLQAFLASGELPPCASLRTVVCSGEALPAAAVQAFHRQHGAALHNLYGPTEAAIDVTAWTCVPQDVAAEAALASIPIGLPIQNVRTTLLDAQLEPVATGASAELYLGGVALARGYLGRPALTAERFVPDPQGEPGSRLYRTGDLASWRADGALEYLGRLDHQIKIRGLRVELGEIEAALLAQPDVRAAVVVAGGGAAGNTVLVAYVAGPAADGADALRRGLQDRLPDYMVPAHIVVLPELPLSANGKIDRKALPPVDVGSAQGVYEVPRGAAESALASVMAQVLGVDRVGRHDNFFALGGDSIVSLQLVGKARQAGWQLSARDVFQSQTLAELAVAATPLANAVAADADTAPARVAGEGELELLPIQRSFFQQAMARPSHWNQSVLLRVHAPLDAAALRAALTAVLAQHEALRLRFDAEGRAWHAAVDAAEAVLWERDVETMDALLPLYEAAQRSLSLEDGPVLRLVWARLANGEQRLLLVAHHLVIDGVSWRVLLGDLQQGYRQALAGEAVQLDGPTQSYKGWSQALWSRAEAALTAEALSEAATTEASTFDATQTDSIQTEADYWRTQHGEPGDVPCDHPTGRATVADEAQITLRLDAARTQQLLRDTSQAYRTQINDLLLTALLRAMDVWRGTPSAVTVGMEGHGRDGVSGQDVSRTVGWFTTLYPVRLNASGPLDSAIKQVKEQLRAVPAGGAGFGVLCAQGSLENLTADLGVIFNYLGQFDASFGPDALGSPAVGEQGGATRDAQAPLAARLVFNGRVYDGELSLTISYSTQQYDADQVQALATAYERELNTVIAHCVNPAHAGITPSDVPLSGLTQPQLDALRVPAAQIEDVYGLSPMQQGLYFHAQSEPGTALYVNQLTVPVTGLDADRLVQAWKTVTARHAVLRSSFEWPAGASAPVQIVRRTVPLPVRREDWRESGAAAGVAGDPQAIQATVAVDTPPTSALAALALEDRARGFDLAEAPLQRLTLVRTSDTEHHLIWTHHHILLDGWSAAALMAEVLRVYRGETLDVPVGEFRDYIAWLAGRAQQSDADFWRQRLSALEEPSLLANVIRPAADAPAGHGVLRTQLDAATLQMLTRYAQRERITLNTLVQGAWTLVLQRYTGQHTVAFGATVAGRPETLRGAQDMLGLFINTVPVIQSPRASERVGPWLRRLQEDNAQLREAGHVPLYDIQRWAGRPGAALFDSIVVFENYPVDAALRSPVGAGPRFGAVEVDESPHYALTLTAGVHDDGLALYWRYLTQVLSDADIQTLAQAFGVVLTALARDADAPLGALPLLPPALSKAQALAAVRGADRPKPAPADTVHDWIATVAARQPDAIALVDAQGALSYGELMSRAQGIAAALLQAGLAPEARVGLGAGRGGWMVAGMLGILLAGGAYVPLDPEYPTARLAHMVQDSGLTRVLVTTDTAQTLALAAGDAPLWNLETLTLPAAGSQCLPRVHASQLAYCIYTSGSTGVPKGVMLPHASVVNFLRSMALRPGLRQGERVLALTSLSFDIAVLELLLPLTVQGISVIASRDEARDPALLLRRLAAEQVDTVQATPSTWRMLLEHTDAAVLDGVRALTGGEALPDDLAQQLAERAAEVWNLYGPTETTVWSSVHRLTSGDPGAWLGAPVADTSLHALDITLASAPAGVAAELVIGGAGLARGYHGRAGLTAERFVPDPYGAPGARMYRTGDLVRREHAGQLAYLGRVDLQVKVRGHRIETGEIEAALTGLAGVAQAAVVARQIGGAAALVAYVTGPAGEERPSVDALQAQLAERLPGYMVPTRLLWVDAMPLTANGKLDRRALSEPDATPRHVEAPPQGQTETRVAQIWCDVLGVADVGRHDDFFLLGGHSLSAARVVSRLRQEWGEQLPLRALFDARTVAELARVLDGNAGEGGLDRDLALMMDALDDMESTNE